MFKDKHVVVAMLVAPVLAVIAWYGVEQFVGEDPHAAMPGAAYSLVAKPNCRYRSGRCDLENGDFEIHLMAGVARSGSIEIELATKLELQSVHLGLSADDKEAAPIGMRRRDKDGLIWGVALPYPFPGANLRVVAQANDAIWYAEISTIFLEPND